MKTSDRIHGKIPEEISKRTPRGITGGDHNCKMNSGARWGISKGEVSVVSAGIPAEILRNIAKWILWGIPEAIQEENLEKILKESQCKCLREFLEPCQEICLKYFVGKSFEASEKMPEGITGGISEGILWKIPGGILKSNF